MLIHAPTGSRDSHCSIHMSDREMFKSEWRQRDLKCGRTKLTPIQVSVEGIAAHFITTRKKGPQESVFYTIQHHDAVPFEEMLSQKWVYPVTHRHALWEIPPAQHFLLSKTYHYDKISLLFSFSLPIRPFQCKLFLPDNQLCTGHLLRASRKTWVSLALLWEIMLEWSCLAGIMFTMLSIIIRMLTFAN